MNRSFLFLCAAALSGCVIAPVNTATRACELLDIASSEADLSPSWYISAGEILEQCRIPDAKADAERRACAADKRNGYECKEAQ